MKAICSRAHHAGAGAIAEGVAAQLGLHPRAIKIDSMVKYTLLVRGEAHLYVSAPNAVAVAIASNAKLYQTYGLASTGMPASIATSGTLPPAVFWCVFLGELYDGRRCYLVDMCLLFD